MIPKRAKQPITLDKAIGRLGWIVVVVSALTLSAWSLYWVGRKYGLPMPLAIIVSAAFDGAAIACADLALKYARTNGDSGLGPRMMVFLLAGTSAYLNVQHAVLTHDPFAARILYAMPPITAVTLFEFHSRYERRGALRRAGRIAGKLPLIDRWAWVLFPARTLGVVRAIVDHRLQVTVARATVSESSESFGSLTVVHGKTFESNGDNPQAIRDWARTRGISIGARGSIPQEITMAYMKDAQENRG